MDLEHLLALARAGHFNSPGKAPASPQDAANDPAPTGTPPRTVAAPVALSDTGPGVSDNAPPTLAAAIRRMRATPDPDAIRTRHWVVDWPGPNPRRVTFTEPQTWPDLWAGAKERHPDRIPPNLLPLPPYAEDEAVQQQTLALDPLPDNDAPLPDTGPTPPADLLAREGVSVVWVRTPEQAAVVVADLLALSDTGPWGFDIETAPLPEYRGDKAAGLDPYRSRVRLAQVYPGGGQCFVFDVAALGLDGLAPVLDRPLVAHNAVFELKHLLHAGANPARLGCTLLMRNALRGDRPGLADLAGDVLGWRLDKTLQVSDWGGDLTPAQRAYAALDAVAAYRLAQRLAPELAARGRARCYGLMRDAQRAIARLELAGCPFDAAAHGALLATWQATAEAARGELDGLLGVNPDSPAQLAGWLKANLPPDLLADWPRTAGGALATDADTLAGLTLPMLEPLARYKAARKLLSTYGTGYAKHRHPITGRLHPSFLLGGTDTGRLACRTPNIQNPPRGADFRALFAPEPGRVLVVADYSQIELRVAALVSGDAAMRAAYAQGEDLHRKTAAAVLGKAPQDVTKGERQMAKAVGFGLLYGQGSKGLQRYAKASYGVDMTPAEADQARRAFFAAYPGLSRWQTRTRKAAERAGQVWTPGGRVRSLEGTRALATESLNTPIQGGAAECLLAALAHLEPHLDGLGAALVNLVHDELVLECAPERAGDVAALVERAMVAGFLAIFPDGATLDLVEAHSGPNWAAAKG